jgi:hypothetical protein
MKKYESMIDLSSSSRFRPDKMYLLNDAWFFLQTLIKSVQRCSNNKEVYLSMMKGHLKRMWVQYMSSWLMEQGLQDPEEAD